MAGGTGYIYRQGTTPNTRLLNTQRVKIYSFDPEADGKNTIPIGLVQTWGPSDSRAVEAVRGIGFGDQIAELAIGVTDLTASATVMMMYLRNVMQIFGYKAGSSGFVRSLKHHRWPFDVYEAINIPDFIKGEAQGGSTNGLIETWYVGCWMSDYSRSFDISATSVTQDMTCTITDVYASPELSGVEFADSSSNAIGTVGKSRIYGK